MLQLRQLNGLLVVIYYFRFSIYYLIEATWERKKDAKKNNPFGNDFIFDGNLYGGHRY